jgi:tetratricopeptide (TPR) repeat protein
MKWLRNKSVEWHQQMYAYLYENLADVKIDLAKLYLKTDQIESAQVTLEELIRTSPDNSEGRIWLGIIYYKLGNMQMAKKQWLTSNGSPSPTLQSKAYQHIAAKMTPSETLR